MAKASSIRALLAFIHAIPPQVVVCIWSGIPCTGGSTLQALNKHRPGHADKMRGHLRLWHRLFSNFLLLAEAVVNRSGYMVLEWPASCRYWKHPRVRALLGLEPLAWHSMKVKACAHGQRIATGKHKGKALTKVWRLESTMPDLASAMSLPCPGDHEHVATVGSLTLGSGKYPAGMAKAFHIHFTKTPLAKRPATRLSLVHTVGSGNPGTAQPSLSVDSVVEVQAVG